VTERIQLGMQTDKNLLRDVARIVRITGGLIRDTVDSRAVEVDEFTERFGIAVLCSCYNITVPIVHVSPFDCRTAPVRGMAFSMLSVMLYGMCGKNV
jgi:hypothetical protein